MGLAKVLSQGVFTSPASAFSIVIIGLDVTILADTSSLSDKCVKDVLNVLNEHPGYAGGSFNGVFICDGTVLWLNSYGGGGF